MKPGGLAQCLPVVSATGIGRYRFAEAWKAGTMGLPGHSKPGHCVGPLGLGYSFESTPGG
ncbi:hypothetical protein Enr13x_15710 [Stieleria neptunia]|uniref:Uncharacterized protein n=1 Tax=Stieleria neptunia TaxID=2527979 RepID=A0A518HLP1_9BACT|nr:hypothetical protein Enr13x_15710 [Stieleria neptunia]